MPPTMARSRAFNKPKQQKAANKQENASRDTHWDVAEYLLMAGNNNKNRRADRINRPGINRKESNIVKTESEVLSELNTRLNESVEANGFQNAPAQQETDRIALSDEAINTMIAMSDTMTEIKESIKDKINKINENEDALLELEYATNNLERVCSYSQLLWKIDDFKHKYNEAASGKNATLYSPPFETHKYGYKLALSFCPFGDGRAKGKYSSLFFCLLRNDYDALLQWPFAHKLTFSLLDQSDIPPYTLAKDVQREDYVMEFTPNPIGDNLPFLGRPTGFRNPSLGLPRFVPIDILLNDKYLYDNSVHIKIEIHLDDIVKL